MKVKCTSIDPKALADHQQSRAVAAEGTYPLTVGMVYPVVGMTVAERALYFLIPDDSGAPCFAHAGFFEVFTADVPAGWRFALEPGIHASGRDLWATPSVATWGYPELVDDPSHVRALLNFDVHALGVFEAYVVIAADD